MCQCLRYLLRCEHVRKRTIFCRDSPDGVTLICPQPQLTTYSYASLPQDEVPACPLPSCPYVEMKGSWNCCFCSQTFNSEGKCSRLSYVGRSLQACEHVCCKFCTPGHHH